MTQEGSCTSIIRQNYAGDLEAAINKQINIEFYASYVYLSMANYFNRDDVALSNIAAWMRKQSDEEREHGISFMNYQNKRGGRVVLQPIQKPDRDDWGSALEAFQAALALEKFNNQALLELHAIGEQFNDAQMSEYLESEFLRDQVNSIEEIGKIIANLKRCGKGIGEYVFDKEFRE